MGLNKVVEHGTLVATEWGEVFVWLLLVSQVALATFAKPDREARHLLAQLMKLHVLTHRYLRESQLSSTPLCFMKLNNFEPNGIRHRGSFRLLIINAFANIIRHTAGMSLMDGHRILSRRCQIQCDVR